MAHFINRLAHAFFRHKFTALLKHDLTLVVHHIIIFEDVFADIEIARFNLLLRFLNRFIDPWMDDGFIFTQAQFLQHPVHSVGSENPHQIIL